MNGLQYTEAAINTSIRTRFKCSTSIEQAKLRIFKKCSMMLFGKYKREKERKKERKTPSGENFAWQVKRKLLLCINLSTGIQMDPYTPIDRPVLTNIER